VCVARARMHALCLCACIQGTQGVAPFILKKAVKKRCTVLIKPLAQHPKPHRAHALTYCFSECSQASKQCYTKPTVHIIDCDAKPIGHVSRVGHNHIGIKLKCTVYTHFLAGKSP